MAAWDDEITARLRDLGLEPTREADVVRELAQHLEDRYAALRADGHAPGAARAAALAELRDDELLRRELAGSLRRGTEPVLLGDTGAGARRSGFADALVRDVLYACRTFRRAPLAALTIVLTVALGLGLVTVVFTFYNALFLQVDAVRNPRELFAVERPTRPGARAWSPFTRPEYEALRRETDVFTDVFAVVRGVGARVQGRPVRVAFVTDNFFQVLGVQAALGRTLTPGDDDRFGPRPVLVLSQRGWRSLFAGDAAVIGRSVPVNGVPYEVVGVMPEDFRGLGVSVPVFWAPLGLRGQFGPASAGREDTTPLDEVVGRLKPGISAEAATARITAWASGRIEGQTTSGDRPASIRLKASQGTLSTDVGGGVTPFGPIFFAFGLILAIGCANVANLLLASGVARQREIGIRLCLGASRRRIVRQLLTESLLLAAAAAALGFVLSRALLELAFRVMVTTLPPEIGEQMNTAALGVPGADWRVLVFLGCGAMASIIVFALMPALQATRLELVRTARGEVTRDARPGRGRNALIALQVSASTLLLISGGVFLRSAIAAASIDPGLRISDTVTVPIGTEPLRAALLQEVTAHQSVAAVAASAPGPLGPLRSLAVAQTVAEPSLSTDAGANMAAERPVTTPVSYQFVSPQYFEVLGIGILHGRAFTPVERSADVGVVVVSQKTAGRLWPGRDAVGQIVRLKGERHPNPQQASAPQLPSGAYTVVGIARDVEGGGVLPFSGPSLYLPIGLESPGTSLTLQVRGDAWQARAALLERLTRVDPALGPIRTLRTAGGLTAYVLRVAFWVAVILAGLAMALTASGLFSVLSYLVEQRAKEIGVRMALGATRGDVTRMVLSQSARPVALGLLTGGGAAIALATLLISLSAASQFAGVIHVLDPVAYVGSGLLILLACVLAGLVPARRAARMDPIATLRME